MYTLLLDILDTIGSSMDGLLYLLGFLIMVAAKYVFCVGGLLALVSISK